MSKNITDKSKEIEEQLNVLKAQIKEKEDIIKSLEAKVKELEERATISGGAWDDAKDYCRRFEKYWAKKYEEKVLKLRTVEAKVKELEKTVLRQAGGMDYYANKEMYEVSEFNNESFIDMDYGYKAREIQEETASVVEKLRGEE